MHLLLLLLSKELLIPRLRWLLLLRRRLLPLLLLLLGFLITADVHWLCIQPIPCFTDTAWHTALVPGLT
jgi:hypothetical protein